MHLLTIQASSSERAVVELIAQKGRVRECGRKIILRSLPSGNASIEEDQQLYEVHCPDILGISGSFV